RDPERLRRSHRLKVLRAHRHGLVCLDRRYLDYPANWDFRRFLIVHLDDYKCHACGKRQATGVELHVHHIVHRSRSGTNDRRNLVTLCLTCHQAQHDHPISSFGGEDRGPESDRTDDCATDNWVYEAMLPTMFGALHYFRTTKGTREEFLDYLASRFSANFLPHARRFAKEQQVPALLDSYAFTCDGSGH
ncbi:MAG: HNH endonuclease, partial [Xanthomonadales bacterium]|nr:HNH endonuclease [Xanthomonadales bacterium]